MSARKMVRSFVARMLIVTMTSAVAGKVDAAMIGTAEAINEDRERVLMLLERPEVVAKLQAYGVSASDAKARVTALSDREIAFLAAEIDRAHAGAGGGEAFVLFVATVILIVVLLPFFIVGALIVGAFKNAGTASHASETSLADPYPR